MAFSATSRNCRVALIPVHALHFFTSVPRPGSQKSLLAAPRCVRSKDAGGEGPHLGAGSGIQKSRSCHCSALSVRQRRFCLLGRHSSPRDLYSRGSETCNDQIELKIIFKIEKDPVICVIWKSGPDAKIRQRSRSPFARRASHSKLRPSRLPIRTRCRDSVEETSKARISFLFISWA